MKAMRTECFLFRALEELTISQTRPRISRENDEETGLGNIGSSVRRQKVPKALHTCSTKIIREAQAQQTGSETSKILLCVWC